MINKDGKRVAVIGSRTCLDKDLVFSVLNKNKDRIKIIVSGGATGADTLATEWAKQNGFPYLVFPALWHDPETGLFDRGAGFRRNRDIIEHCDVVIAFWDKKSGGTKNSIEIANQLKKPVKIIEFSPVENQQEPENLKQEEAEPF